MMAYLNNYKVANKLVEDEEFKRRNYRAYIPMHFISISGVMAGIPIEVSTEELEEYIHCEVPILGIRRLNTWFDGKPQPSQRVSITFRANELPRMVKMLSCTTKVRPFYKKSILCMNCLRYSHRTENCRSKKRCVRCAMVHQEEEEDYERCLRPIKCLYCRKEHTTTDRDCPERKRQDNIQAIMAKTNLTFIEAKERFPILTENQYEALLEMTDDPTPAESYANMTANHYVKRNQPKTKRTTEKQPSRIISEDVTVFQEKKRKADTLPDGAALFNKHKVSDAEKWKAELRAAAANKQGTSENKVTPTTITTATDPTVKSGPHPKNTILVRHTSTGKIAHPITKK